MRKILTYLTLMEQKIIDIGYFSIISATKSSSHQKFADLLLIIQLLTYIAGEMTITIGILIGSSSLDDKWQDASLSYQHIYKAFKTYNRKKKKKKKEES